MFTMIRDNARPLDDPPLILGLILGDYDGCFLLGPLFNALESSPKLFKVLQQALQFVFCLLVQWVKNFDSTMIHLLGYFMSYVFECQLPNEDY